MWPPAVRLPNATATPPIICRRLVACHSVLRLVLPLIIHLQTFILGAVHNNTNLKYVQDHIFMESKMLFEPYCAEIRRTYALRRWPPYRDKRENHSERAPALQSPRL